MVASISSERSTSNTSMPIWYAPGRPDSRALLVTITAHPGPAGSSGMTWSSSVAPSSTTSTFRFATRLR